MEPSLAGLEQTVRLAAFFPERPYEPRKADGDSVMGLSRIASQREALAARRALSGLLADL